MIENFSDKYPKNQFIQLNKNDVDYFASSLYDLIQNAYSNIGGHIEFSSVDSFKNTDLNFWIASDIDDDPNADVVIGGKYTEQGIKITLGGQDGSRLSIATMISKIKDLMKQKGFYTEMDEELARKVKLQPIEDFDVISKVLENKQLVNLGNGIYERKIGGKWKRKVLVGIPSITNSDIEFAKGGKTNNQLLAPNGKPSNLTKEQWELVRTPQFKAWFGDWEKDSKNSSKVIDKETKEPLVVYHGTNASFTIFDTDSESENRKGGIWDAEYPDGYIFMISDKKRAKYYGQKVIPLFVNLKYPIIKRVEKGSSLVLPFDDEGLAFEGDAIVTDGFDYLVGTQNEYAVKLADGSNTTFDDDNPDIRFAEGGRIEKMIENGVVELKMYDTTPKHAKEYGLNANNPLYIQRIFVNENDRNKGLGKEVLQYVDKYAKDNGHDLIFGHIQQKANPSRVKILLEKNDYTTIVGNNDFYKFVGKFAEGGKTNNQLLAPNGKPSNLSKEQWELVRTPKFKAWFGDWENDPENASKVVDENFEPLVVYHGTQASFNKFKKQNTYFTDSKKYIKSLIGKDAEVKEVFINSKKVCDLTMLGFREISFAKFTNECVKQGAKKNYADYEELEDYVGNDKYMAWQFFRSDEPYLSIMATNWLEYFFDVIIYKNSGLENSKSKTLLFISSIKNKLPNQIKLADGSNTTFDGNNPDIRFAEGGMTYREYADSQFNEEEDLHLPSGYLSDFEIKKSDKKKFPILFKEKNGLEYRLKNDFDSSIRVFDGDKEIGYADNKAIMVAPTYQKKGIGLELVSILKERNPNHRFGSMTPEGFALMGKYYDTYIANNPNIRFEEGGEVDTSFVHWTNTNGLQGIFESGVLLEESSITNNLQLPFDSDNNMPYGIILKPSISKYSKRIGSIEGVTELESLYEWRVHQDINIKDFFDGFVVRNKTNKERLEKHLDNNHSYWNDFLNYYKKNGYNISIVKNTKFAKGGKTNNQLLAPNGKPSKLNKEQWELVRTPQFKAWFGDWENDSKNSSKVVDENGEPLAVYHGTKSTNDFHIFNDSNFIYFSNKKSYVEKHFSKNLMENPFRLKEYFLNIRNLLNVEHLDFEARPYEQIQDLLLPIFDIDNDVEEVTKYKNEYIRFWEVLRFSKKLFPRMKQNKVYDGILFYENWNDNTTWEKTDDWSLSLVVVDANQIKLADGSNTTFDDDNPDIRFAEGGTTNYGIDELYEIATEKFESNGYEVTQGSNSKTDYGHSRYFYVNQNDESKENSGLGFQVRVSDHSTGDRRILNAEQFIFNESEIEVVYNRINYWFHPEEYKNLVAVKNKVVQIEVGENDLQPSDSIISERVAKSGSKRYIIKRTYKNEGIVPTHVESGFKLPFKPNNPDIRYEEGGEVTQVKDLSKIPNYTNIYKGVEYYSMSDNIDKQKKSDEWFELFRINQKERELTKDEFSKFMQLSNELAWEDFKQGGITKNKPMEKEFIAMHEGELPSVYKKGGSIKKGGITYGPSHDDGGIKVLNKATNTMLEVEGGELVVNKQVAALDTKVNLNGKEMTPCEAVSELNQMAGNGVAFNCKDVANKQFLEDGGELQKGIEVEKEHMETLDKLYNQDITPSEAIQEVALEHILENPNYYEDLKMMEHEKNHKRGCSCCNNNSLEVELKIPRFDNGGIIDFSDINLPGVQGVEKNKSITDIIEEKESKRVYTTRELKNRELYSEAIDKLQKLMQVDYKSILLEGSATKYLERYLGKFKHLNLYKLGWRGTIGVSKQWAGLCSVESNSNDIKELNKAPRTISISYNYIVGDDNFGTFMEDTILHEIAHAIVFEIFYLNEFEIPFDQLKFYKPEDVSKFAHPHEMIDPQHFETKGHGVTWANICNTLTGGYICDMFYRMKLKNEQMSNYMYKCINCNHEGFGDNPRFANKCANCNTPVLIQKNQ